MTKIRKLKRRKKFRADVNRKRLKNRKRRPGKVRCDIVKRAWDNEKSVRGNLEAMGLTYDPNKNIKISKLKEDIISDINATSKWSTEYAVPVKPSKPEKAFVVEELEKEANAPRERKFGLPKSQVEWLSSLMDKYGSDYKAMAKDKTNYYQKTWKQIRAKIKIFMKIPEQYSEYLKQAKNEASEQLKDIEDDSD